MPAEPIELTLVTREGDEHTFKASGTVPQAFGVRNFNQVDGDDRMFAREGPPGSTRYREVDATPDPVPDEGTVVDLAAERERRMARSGLYHERKAAAEGVPSISADDL